MNSTIGWDGDVTVTVTAPSRKSYKFDINRRGLRFKVRFIGDKYEEKKYKSRN